MRKHVKSFADAMEEKLKERDDEHGEQGWLEHPCTVKYLHDRLMEETRELTDALDDCDPQAAMRECVDVGNFAMMIRSRLIDCGICGDTTPT